ncbi:GNAT family N-acetyltransferase [Mucilaginibacter phyllosphaerae]
MEHVLDNPIYNALLSGSKHLAVTGNDVSFFKRDTAPFAATANNSATELAALEELITESGAYVFFSPQEIKFPTHWQLLRRFDMLQMVYEGLVLDENQPKVINLDDSHVPQMMALTELTKPGPFLPRTVDFTNYTGIFDEDELVAMAGHRMQPSPYTEISAVCTHPGHLGKGYAGIILRAQIKRIIHAGNIPFLHVLADNYSAISVYERIGFKTRRPILGYVCQISK